MIERYTIMAFKTVSLKNRSEYKKIPSGVNDASGVVLKVIVINPLPD